MPNTLRQIELKPIEHNLELPVIKQDEIAEEVFAARQYSKRLTRTVVVGQAIILVVFSMCIVGLATRPAKHIYVKIDEVGRATPVKYSDLEHYTPDAAVAKTYLTDWANYRFRRLSATVLDSFPKNYLFLEANYGAQVKQRDQRENVVASILANREPENDIQILSTTLTSFGKQSLGNTVISVGSGEIALQKIFRKGGAEQRQTWIIALRFYVNPEQVEKQSEDHPEYQDVNPLGLTIIEFIANRTNVEAKPQ